MTKAFMLRLLRSALFGVGAFIMMLALDVRIRSSLDVAGYMLGAGAAWYLIEVIVMRPGKKPPDRRGPPPGGGETIAETRAKAKKKKEQSSLGSDHF